MQIFCTTILYPWFAWILLKQLFLTDFFEGGEHFGGDLENNQYTFNISKYLSQLINEELFIEDLYLMPIGASVNANRTLLTGEVELIITYTEF